MLTMARFDGTSELARYIYDHGHIFNAVPLPTGMLMNTDSLRVAVDSAQSSRHKVSTCPLGDEQIFTLSDYPSALPHN
jgi:hypothetical protein